MLDINVELGAIDALFKQGQYEACLNQAKSLLQKFPDHGNLWKAVGVCLIAQQKYIEAIPSLKKASTILLQDAESHYLLGIAFHSIREFHRARQSYERTLELSPDYPNVHINLGTVFKELDEKLLAIEMFERAKALDANSLVAYVNLASLYERINKPEEAVQCYERIVQIDPKLSGAYTNLANLLHALKRYEQAEAAYHKAIASNTAYADAYSNLSHFLCEYGRPVEAEIICHQAIVLKPHSGEFYTNLGLAYHEQCLLKEAEAAYRHSLDLGLKDSFVTRMNLAMLCLKQGRYAEGWSYYEARFEMQAPRFLRLSNLPQWEGQPVGATDGLLLYSEQGRGDVIQFMRFLPELSKIFSKIRLLVPPELSRLAKENFPHIDVQSFIHHEIDQDCQWSCPMMSLGRALKINDDNLAKKIPYLTASSEWTAPWLQMFAQEKRPKIGVVWAANLQSVNGVKRSLSLKDLAPCFAAYDYCWVSLQYPSQQPLIDEWSQTFHMMNPAEKIQDLADVAGLISALDLVITVDTVTVHLAGALGKPAWLLDRYTTDWKWGLDTTRSRWYPTVEIFRQENYSDWASVVQAIKERLASHFNN